MSRVHDALRRAELLNPGGTREPVPAGEEMPFTPIMAKAMAAAEAAAVVPGGTTVGAGLLEQVEVVPYTPAPESHLIDWRTPQETPSEEFRSLRTRMNHAQTLQTIHTVVVTSPSPAEGKSFTAANFALAESHLADNMVLLADFDLRRPVLHNLFQIPRTPGVSDYLTGQAPLSAALRKIEGTNLYFMPAGTPVKNPLELLNLRDLKSLVADLPNFFNWVILDTPPLLFSADANLLSTMADGILLVVKIGSTTIDTVTRAMQSLCENNIIGVVANGARAGELYSKYTYYYSKTD
jgi:protein-tyrosine kinase